MRHPGLGRLNLRPSVGPRVAATLEENAEHANLP